MKDHTDELEDLKKKNVYRIFFENSMDAMLTLCDGIFIDCNQSTVKMLRAKNKEEVLNKAPWILSPEYQADGQKSIDKAKDMFSNALKKGPLRFEWLHKRMDGDLFPAEVSLTPIPIEGKIIFNSTLRDISDMKLAEKKVGEYQEHLEELVKERTKELEDVNEALKKENTYRFLLESSTEAMFIMDKKGVFVDCNQSAVRILRAKSKDDIVNTTPVKWTPELQPNGFAMSDEKCIEIINETFKNGSNKFEWHHMRADGDVFPAEVLITTIIMEGKKLFHVVWRDISERKQAEQKVREYQEHLEELVKERTKELENLNEALKKENTYRLFFESSPDAMLLMDNFVFIDCNQGAVNMLGLKSKDEIMNTGPAKWTPAISPTGKSFSEKKAREVVNIALKKGFHRFEWYHMRANGEVFPVEVLLATVTIEGRKQIHVSWRDISDRKQAEEKIKEYQEHLEELVEERTKALEKLNKDLQLEIKEHQRLESDIEQILDVSGDAIRVIDDEFNIIYVNEQFAKFSELSEADLIGRKCYEVTPEKECHSKDCALTKILSGEAKIERDTQRLFYKSGIIPCSMTCAPYTDSDGKIVGIVENYRDISERVAAQELAEKNALQQGRIEMSNNILHDIGNAAVGTSTYIIRLLSEKTWAECKSLERLLSFVSQEKDGITKTLGKEKAENLLDFAEKLYKSLIIRNKQVLELGEKISKSVGHINSVLNLQRQYIKDGLVSGGYVNICLLLRNAVLMQSANSEKRDIALTLHFEPGIPLSIPGDNTRLMQVTLNILKNACEAFDDIQDDRTRYLKINVYKLELDGKEELRIVFEDNAVGLSEDILEKVFERGFTTKSSGTGIGLDQCRAIINSHGGKIWIKSKGMGKGTSVIIELPVMQPERQN